MLAGSFNRGSILNRTIGIIYRTEAWLDALLKILLDGTSAKNLYRDRHKIVLEDGTLIRCICEGRDTRGIKLDKAYVQEGIPLDYFFTSIIPCCVTDGYRSTFVIDEHLNTIKRIDFYVCGKEQEQKEMSKEEKN